MTTTVLEGKLEQIGKLLIQAERTDNKEEKMVFFEKAQALSSKYSIELELARAKVLKGERREQPVQKIIHIGEPGKPLNAVFCNLIMGIGRAQDLKFNIAHNSTYVVAFGFPSDIAVTEAFYANVMTQMIEMGDAWVRGREWAGEQTWCTGTHRYKPVTARVARRCFYEEFIHEIERRLMQKKREAEAAVADEQVEVATDHGVESTSTELVLANKQVEVRDFYSATSTARGSWKGNRGNTANSTSARSAGRAAGSQARLGGEKSIGGGRKAIG